MKLTFYKNCKTIAYLSLTFFLITLVLDKTNVKPEWQKLYDLQPIFVIIYFVAISYYYKYYLIKKKDEEIRFLKYQMKTFSRTE